MINMLRPVGMGGFGLPDDLPYPTPDPIYGAPDDGSTQTGPGSGNIWSAQLPTLIGLGLRDLRDIFAPTQTSQADYRAQQQQTPYYPQTTGAPRSLVSTSTIGADSGGVTLFGSRIGWMPILIVAAILFFPGFSRRRNPETGARRANPKHRRHVKRARRRR